MNKASLKKTVSAVVVAATITTLSPLGVSAQWRQNTDSTWSYTESNNIHKGWKNISDIWYYFNSKGNMNTGWICDNGTWYYNNNSGAMEKGWVNVDGNWYYCGDTGAMKTGWIKDNNKWYYADNTGVMQKGIIKINEKTYYLNNSGEMLIGKVKVGNKLYSFNSNGEAIETIPQGNNQVNLNDNIVAKPNISEDNQKTDTKIENNINNNKDSNENANTTTNNNTTNNTNTTNTNNTVSTTADINGLPSLPKNYAISVQAAAENKILELMNQKRTEAGLKPLTMDNTLLQVARYKSNHMIQYSYFDHTNPDGTKWTDWLKSIGYKYTATGENIAYNTYDAVELFNQWWNSSGHRANMMNASYTKVGVGVLNGNGQYMGTQEFSN